MTTGLLRPLRRVRGGRIVPGDRGNGPVELAILAFPILIVTWIVVQAALVFYARTTALAAATQGANAARSYGSSPAVGKDKAEQFLRAVGGPLENTSVTVKPGTNEVTVTVTGKATTIFPWVSFTVRQSAHGPVERFVT